MIFILIILWNMKKQRNEQKYLSIGRPKEYRSPLFLVLIHYAVIVFSLHSSSVIAFNKDFNPYQ